MRTIVALIRPKTLFLALAVIVAGNALAAYYGSFHFDVFILSLLTALSLQILSNLANDYGDGVRGTDDFREGPERALAANLVTLKQIKLMICVCVLLVCVFGISLLTISIDSTINMIIFLFLGLLSIIAAIKYTIGDNAYGYKAQGEVAVFIFFGLIGVAGSYYLQTHQWRWSVLLPAFASGCLAAGVLNINNIRDIDSDAAAGKETLAVKFGFQSSIWLHTWIIIIALACYLLFATLETWWSALWIVLLPSIRVHGKTVLKATQPSIVGKQLSVAVLITFGVNVFFALGLLINLWLSSKIK